ncbi:MAG: DNA polymerase III subunit alpha [Rhodothermales bacterium]|nr:DNA polymerase III subunit alpha [Rhodothermales bacterium]
MFAHLHTRSWFSFLAGGSSPEALAQAASKQGISSAAITDVGGVYGAVRFQQACRDHGIKSILGAEVNVDGYTLVLLATSLDGYANLCQLLTSAHLRRRLDHIATFDELCEHAGDLHCMTGARGSYLWHLVDKDRMEAAQVWVQQLHAVFGRRLSIELSHHLYPGDTRRLHKLTRLSNITYVPVVATGDVRYAVPEDYARYDLVTCVRLGITIFDAHEERPANAEAFLRSEPDLYKLIPFRHAFERANQIAEECNVDLLPGYITPPAASIPASMTAQSYLTDLCDEAFERRYAGKKSRDKARAQLTKELDVIRRLDLEEFFLVVREITEESRRRGIRCAGRGSAANSIVAYLLGITGVDPLEHNLLFERFLHAGRRGTPDIDVDFDSDRRDEIIAWMDERFGIEQTAMTATITTYRTRSALRDTAKALGWPMEQVNRMSKAVSPHAGKGLDVYRVKLEQIVGPSPLLGVLLERADALYGSPRHLGLHSGGMVLSRKPLYHFTPVQESANGVKMVTFDKDDIEALGLVKFDVLGLRMLACLSEAVELIHRHLPDTIDIDELSLDDIPTFNMIRAGKTLGVFQIESQGQLHLLGQHQPENFGDLINEIALFRPGPLQGGMVHPFVRRRRGLEEVEYMHPHLEPVLKDTYGVIIYQEQVLEVAHQFAGMSLIEADEFRRLMSKFRDPGQMESMRTRFVTGAMEKGVPEDVSNEVFDKVSNFVGYGFCRSHAAAFAKTVYQSAYLKRHFAAPFMAAFMQHRPGFYNLMTLEEEARRFDVDILMPDINRSSFRYDLEPKEDGTLAIRKPLSSIQSVTIDTAKMIVWERLRGPFESVEDLYRRIPVGIEAFRNIARSGAMDEIAGGSRKALWEVGLMARRHGQPGANPKPELFEEVLIREEDIPDLDELTTTQRYSWDYETHGAARTHPMTLMRRSLNELEIRPIETCYQLGKFTAVGSGKAPTIVTTAGLTALRQRPITAKGVMFVTLEDETGMIQTIVLPNILEHLDHVLSQSALIVRGKLQVMGNWRGLVVTQAWPLNGIFGGYAGHPSMGGGRDTFVTRPTDAVSHGTIPGGTDLPEITVPGGKSAPILIERNEKSSSPDNKIAGKSPQKSAGASNPPPRF